MTATTPTTATEPTVLAKPGDYRDVLGVRIRHRASPAQSDGALALLECDVPPGATIPLHTHPQVEAFYVLSGELEFALDVGGAVRCGTVPIGQTVLIPRDTRHSFSNASNQTARVLITCEPALVRFFDEAGVPLAEVPPGPPSAAAIARVVQIAEGHGHRFYGPHPGSSRIE
jgi:quercetin dioxygenase-like cupin family protein